MTPIQYYSCFISYSSSDEVLARRLHADLQDKGVRCWFAPHDLRPGQLMRKGIDEAIHMQDKLLLILSKASVESGWVEYEVETALTREVRQKREILFPIRIDDAIFESSTSWACELRERRHMSDFRQWADPEQYHRVFQRLLRDLKAQT
jgi:TIR domain